MFESLKVALINIVKILLISVKHDTRSLLEIKVIWNKVYDVIIYVHDVINKILLHESNCIVDMIMRPKTSSRNHICKISGMFVKKKLKINMLKIKSIVKLETFVIVKVNIELLHICNLEYSVPKEIYVVFRSGSNYDYHFAIKNLAKEFEGQFTCLQKKCWKLHNLFSFSRKRNFFIDQDLRQTNYQFLSIISLKKSIKLNVNTIMKIKKMRKVCN